MTQFHEGQEVEVATVLDADKIVDGDRVFGEWRKAKIVGITRIDPQANDEPVEYDAEFPDGTRRIFHANHIRTK